MTRAQVRATVRWESMVISLIGALSGAGLGIGIGLALSQAMKDVGIKAISIPGFPWYYGIRSMRHDDWKCMHEVAVTRAM